MAAVKSDPYGLQRSLLNAVLESQEGIILEFLDAKKRTSLHHRLNITRRRDRESAVAAGSAGSPYDVILIERFEEEDKFCLRLTRCEDIAELVGANITDIASGLPLDIEIDS